MTHHEEKPKLDHVEFASKDPAATRQFLEKVFGFKITVMPEMGGYAMHGRNEGAVAASFGVRELMGPEQPGSVVYITVGNIDEALKNVKAAGASIMMEKTEIPGIGWSAVYHAPGGVVQGLFQNKPTG